MARDLTVEVLREIRDEMRGMRGDLGKTNERLDQTNERLDQTNERLDQVNGRLDQTNSRLGRVEHGLVDLGGFMRQIALDQARHERFHVHHVEVLERDVADLKGRVSRLEGRAGD
jgi:chromosome segregation ATPase